MSDNDTKIQTPPYVPFKTFINFINSLRDNGIPTQINRSIMGGMSGSYQSSIIGALEYLKLVSKTGEPTKELHQLVESEDNKRSPILSSVLERSYQFLFSGTIDIKRATTKHFEDAFRTQGTSGSTVVKCIAFFLAAAKEAGIQISPYVKTPTIVRAASVKRAGAQGNSSPSVGSDSSNYEPSQGTRSLKLPLLGKQDVVLLLPEDFNQEDWKFLKPILEAYIGRLFDEQ